MIGTTAPTAPSTERFAVQYRQPTGLPRAERRLLLQRVFAALEEEVLRPAGAGLVPDSLSVSGQTVEAELPVGRRPEIVAAIEGRGFDVRPAVDHQVAPPF